MGLYLCVFDDEEEISGVEVGAYADFTALRDYVTNVLEGGNAGSRFPTFIIHSDCDGEWSAYECRELLAELSAIAAEMKSQPPVPFSSDWQKKVAKSVGLTPTSAFESFVDVDGEFVLDRISHLATVAIQRNLPILFQ